MSRQPEGRLKEKIGEYLESKGAYYAPIPGGACGFIGAPDMVVCYKGRFIGLEAKTPVGKASGWQKRHSEAIKAAGGISFFPRELKDVEEVLEAIDRECEDEDA